MLFKYENIFYYMLNILIYISITYATDTKYTEFNK